MKKYGRYEYEWTDCQTEDSWVSSNDLIAVVDAHTRRKFINIGYFLLERDGFYVFTAGHTPATEGDEVQYFHLTFIPKGMVLKIKKI